MIIVTGGASWADPRMDLLVPEARLGLTDGELQLPVQQRLEDVSRHCRTRMNVDAEPFPRHGDDGAADEVCGMQDRASLGHGQLGELILRPDTPLDPGVRDKIAAQLAKAEDRFAAIAG